MTACVRTGLCVVLVAAGAAACTALRLGTRFTPGSGPLPDSGLEATDEASIAIFLDAAPEGFDWVAEQPEVQVGYGHRLLGRVALYVKAGFCGGSEPGVLGREAVFSHLRARAARAGADALIFVRTQSQDERRSDCGRLDRAGDGARTEPWAVGWAVRLEREDEEDAGLPDGGLPDAGAPDTAPPDAGLSDAGSPRDHGPAGTRSSASADTSAPAAKTVPDGTSAQAPKRPAPDAAPSLETDAGVGADGTMRYPKHPPGMPPPP